MSGRQARGGYPSVAPPVANQPIYNSYPHVPAGGFSDHYSHSSSSGSGGATGSSGLRAGVFAYPAVPPAAAGGGGGGGGPQIARPVGEAVRVPAATVVAGGERGGGAEYSIRVAIRPEFRISPAVQPLPHASSIPNSSFQVDFNAEKALLSDDQKPWTHEGIGAYEESIMAEYVSKGLDREAVTLAIVVHGNVQKKVFDFCRSYVLLREMGFPRSSIAGSLALVDNDSDTALTLLAP